MSNASDTLDEKVLAYLTQKADELGGELGDLEDVRDEALKRLDEAEDAMIAVRSNLRAIRISINIIEEDA